MKVLVIGGGPAGMAAACSAAFAGAGVILIEHNEKLGKKLFITGKGRCNVTNTADKEDFFRNIVTNPAFLYSAYSEFDNAFVMDFFEKNGTSLKIERGGRVFPLSDKAVDITKTFERIFSKYDVGLQFGTEAVRFNTEKDLIYSLATDKGDFTADAFILATGGKSYSSTGSNGSGYLLAASVGHNITPLRPSLCGIKTKQVYPLMGLTLKNVKVTFIDERGKKDTEFGELLFTHEGISGPTVLTLSAKHNKKDINGCKIEIDLKPALDNETLDARLLRDFSENINKEYKNSLNALLPQSMIPVFVQLSGIRENKRVNEITSAERKRIISLLKAFPLETESFCDFDTAVVTSGGVNVKEIYPKTMQSRIMKNLYFAGEIIDVDALTGGFNIQIALTTGFTAGRAAAMQTSRC